MAIKNTEKELNLIYQELSAKKMVLPNFQRGFVWDRSKQKNLVASVIVDLPVGSLLILEGDINDFSKRQLCFPDELEISNETSCQYVLDGQQRLSTLRTVFYDVFSEKDNWKEIWDGLYGSLRTRWFIRVKPVDDEEDYFGYSPLKFTSISYLTDNDIQDFIEHKVIHKTKTNEPHHPGLILVDEQGDRVTSEPKIRNHIADSYASEFLVPLYEINKKDKGIHRRVLKKIADKRINELKIEAEVNCHALEFYEKLFGEEIYDSIEELQNIVDTFSEESISTLEIENKLSEYWAKLSAQWTTNLAVELEKLTDRVMSIIFLHRDEVNRAVAIFEAINQGGAPLSVYDLVVAKSAREKNKKNLSTRIIESVQKNIDVKKELNSKYVSDNGGVKSAKWVPSVMGIIDGNEPSRQLQDWFVNVLSLLVYIKEKENNFALDFIKRERILKLSSEDINSFTDRTITAIARALSFLLFRCGVTSANEVSYKLMLVVLAFFLDDDKIWSDENELNKLECWYWVSLLGGGYFARQNERCIDDLNELQKYLYCNDGQKITGRIGNILNYQDYVTKDILLRKDADTEIEQTSVKRAVLQFILSGCPEDFNTTKIKPKRITPWGIASGEIEVELHHIIPLGNVAKIGQSSSELRSKKLHPLNSPLNYAYITKDANRLISDKSPDEYLSYLESLTLSTHHIPPVEHFKKAWKSSVTDDKEGAAYYDVLERRFDLIKAIIENRINHIK
jgi:uncharacterized protein with ParB-like and HNH nuclease domain